METHQLYLVEPASDLVEQILAETCQIHPGTTFDWDGTCPVCALQANTCAEPEPITKGWVKRAIDEPQPLIKGWVQRAMDGTLPAKTYR